MMDLNEQIIEALNRPKDLYDRQKVFDGVELEGCSENASDHTFMKITNPGERDLELSLDITEVNETISFFAEFWLADGSFLKSLYLATCFSSCCPDKRKITFPIPKDATYTALNFSHIMREEGESKIGLMRTKDNEFPELKMVVH